MILSIFLKTCFLWSVLCLGVDDSQPTYRDVQMQREQAIATSQVLDAQNRQQWQELQATREAAGLSAQATADARDYQGQSEQRSIAATEQARQDAMQVQQAQMHATASVVEARERTDRVLIMETGATERLYKTEIERTNRLTMVLDFLLIVVVGLVAIALSRWISNIRQGQYAPAVVQIDTVPADAPRIPVWQFVQRAEQHRWEYDIYKDGDEMLGFRYLAGRRIVYLLEDHQNGAGHEPMA